MKKATWTRIMSVVLCALMVLSCAAGITFVSAEDADEFILTAEDLATTGAGAHGIQIDLIDDYCEYTTLEGDPYVWYNGAAASIKNYQFMEVTYRTTDSEDACYFCGKSGNFDNKTFPVIADGEWHTTVVDLSRNSKWGEGQTEFRFDPKNAGAVVGATIDFKQVRFFNYKTYNRVWALEPGWDTNPTTDWVYVKDAATGNNLCPLGVDVTIEPGTSLLIDGWIGIASGSPIIEWDYSIDGSAWTAADCTICPWPNAEGFVPGQFAAAISVAAASKADEMTNQVSDFYLPTADLTGGLHSAAVRVLTAAYEQVVFNFNIEVADYVVVELANGSDGVWGSMEFGIRFQSATPVTSFTWISLATYAGSGKEALCSFYQWDTDYDTTVAGTPLYEYTLVGHPDNGDAVIPITNSAVKGDILAVLTPTDGNWTPKQASDLYVPGTEFFRGGNQVAEYIKSRYVAQAPQEIVYDLTKGGGLVVATDASANEAPAGSVFYGKSKRFGAVEYDGFTKLVQSKDNAEDYMIGDVNMKSAFKYAAVVYRTTSPYAGYFKMWTTDDPSFGTAMTSSVTYTGVDLSGNWAVAYIDLAVAEGLAEINDIRFDFLHADAVGAAAVPANEYVDVAYIAFFKSAAKRAAYDFGLNKLTKDQWFYSRSVESYQVLFGNGQGSPSNPSGLGHPFGMKFTVDGQLDYFFTYGMATYSDPNTTGTVKLWAWDTDYDTTVSGTVLYEEFQDHPADCQPQPIDLSGAGLGAGTYYIEFECLEGAGWTPWASTDGALNGSVAYYNGAEGSPFTAWAGVTGENITNANIGDPNQTTPTYAYDFTRYIANTNTEFGWSNGHALLADDTCDKGYIGFHGQGGDPYVLMKVPPISTIQAAYAVVKYRSNYDTVIEFFANTSDGTTMGKPGSSCPKAITGDGQWHVEIWDMTPDWGAKIGVDFTAFRIDPGTDAGDVDIAYIEFYSNEAAALARVDAETKVVGAKGIVALDAENIVEIDGQLYAYEGTEEKAYETVACDLVAYTGPVSDDTFIVDGANVKDGSAGAYIRDNMGGVLGNPDRTYHSVGFRGWAGSQETEIVAYGYQLNDNEPVFSADFVQDAEGPVKNAGGPASTRYTITIGLDDLADGLYNIYLFVKFADGNFYRLAPWGDMILRQGAETYVAYTGLTPLTYQEAQTEEKAYEAVEATFENEKTNAQSADTFYRDKLAHFQIDTSVGDGGANAWLQNYWGGILDNTAKEFGSYTFRGWYGDADHGQIDAFGYQLNNNEPVWVEGAMKPTEPAVMGAAGTDFASRYEVVVDLATVADGCYKVYVLAKHSDGAIMRLAGWGDVTLMQGAQTYDEVIAPACYTFDTTAVVTDAPVAPKNPNNLKNYTVFDGRELFTNDVPQGIASAEYNAEGGYYNFTVSNGDPQYYQIRGTEYTVPTVLAIKYRARGNYYTEGFMGNGGGATGSGDHYDGGRMIGDNEWHIQEIDLSNAFTSTAQYNEDGTLTINYWRFDFVANDDTADVDIAWVGFFEDFGEAECYDEFLYKTPVYLTVTFVKEDGDIVVRAIEYRKGNEASVTEPKVPAKDGFEGAWEEYTLGKKDIVVKAVYTELPTEPAEETQPEDPGEQTEPAGDDQPTEPAGDDQPTEPAGDDQPTEPAGDDQPTEAPATEAPATEAPAGDDATGEGESATEAADEGCKSAVISAAVVLTAIAAAFVCSKKRRS